MQNHEPSRITSRLQCLATASILVAVTLPFFGCAKTAKPLEQPIVEQFGGMREVMRGGQTQARYELSAANVQPGTVAVGAIEGLAGEVTIYQGQVWVARPEGNQIIVTGPVPVQGDHATLLTVTNVERWVTLTIKTQLQGQSLEAYIEQIAYDWGIDTTKPFPFIIEGELDQLALHVINGYCPVAVDPATMDVEPWHWTSSQKTNVTIVGFYAADAAGTMTHHGTALHAHAILNDTHQTLTGHIDHMVITPGMKLKLPAVD